MDLGFSQLVTVTNPEIGDLMLGADGDEVVLTELSQEVAQRLHCAFQFFKGEWFADLDEGTPWFEYILRKGPGDRIIRSIFRQVIEGCEGVRRLLYFTYSIGRDRHMTASFKCLLEDGTTFTSSEYGSFVIATV